MFKLFLATPDKKLVTDQELEEITVPAHLGELHILPGHSPLMTTLQGGILRYRLKGSEMVKLAIGWGYCQVSSDGVTVLAETAATKSELESTKINEQLKGNELKLINESLDDSDWEKIQNEMGRLRAELDLLNEKSH